MNPEVKSAARIIEVLEFLARASEPVSLKDVVNELGYPKSSAHGLLTTLVGRGYAVRHEGDRYALNEACRSGPGWIGGDEARLIAVARPLMDELRDDLGESVFLGARLRNGDVKHLAKSVSRQAIRYDTERSGPVPAYCTAMGRVLLAFWRREAVENYLSTASLVPQTPYTVTDKAALAAILANVRRDGYAISDQEMVLGGSGVAAPVWNRAGQVVAALNLGVVAPRFAEGRERMIAGVVGAARLLSARFGFKDAGEERAA